MTVLCLVERDGNGAADASLRALSFARQLAASSGESLAAALFATAGDVPAAVRGSAGAADAYAVASTRLAGYAPVAWARALQQLIAACSATAVVAAGTDRGSEVLAHLGAITGLPVAAGCAAAGRTAPGSCRLVRHRWAGSVVEDAVLEASPALLTVAVDAVAAEPAAVPGAPAVTVTVTVTVHECAPELAEHDGAVCAVESAERSGGVSLATARVVVGGGRGVGSPEGF